MPGFRWKTPFWKTGMAYWARSSSSWPRLARAVSWVGLMLGL